MRRAAKTDSNQTPLVEAYRQLGCSVQHLHQLGKGCPDLLIGFGWPGDGIGLNILQEVKYGNADLTGDEPEWHAKWKGQVEIVSSTAENAIDVAVERFEHWRDVADLLAELTRKL